MTSKSEGYRRWTQIQPTCQKASASILLIFKPVKHQYNLQHFSYHYHHYSQHCISKFWQVRNLRLPFHYLPKFTFWQVCSLVVFVTCQNLILASMFVGRVCLSVCLFVCLYGNFTKSQKRLSQSSLNLVTSKHQSMVPASSLDKNVAQITRSRGQKLGQILKSP